MSSQFNLVKLELHCNNTVYLETDKGSHLIQTLELSVVAGMKQAHMRAILSHPLPAKAGNFRIQLHHQDSPIQLIEDQSQTGISSLSRERLVLVAADPSSNEKMIQMIKSYAAHLG